VSVREPMNKKTAKPECVTCGEYHPATETCLGAWLHGLKSPGNNSNKSLRFRANESQPVESRYRAKIVVSS